MMVEKMNKRKKDSSDIRMMITCGQHSAHVRCRHFHTWIIMIKMMMMMMMEVVDNVQMIMYHLISGKMPPIMSSYMGSCL